MLFECGSPALRKHLNHFALRAKLYTKAIRVAFDELQVLRAA
jgi:hypothetical protein